MSLARLSLVGLLVVGCAYLGISAYIVSAFSQAHRQPVAENLADSGLAATAVRLTTADGLELAAWWAPQVDAIGTALLAHGSGGNRGEEYMLAAAQVYASAGMNVLLVDLRGHGDSQGERSTGGYQEVRDVEAAVDWLEGQGIPASSVVLHGVSMGGATVIEAAPGLEIAAVVTEAAYASLPQLLSELLPEAGVPRLFLPGMYAATRLWRGVDPWAVRPKRSAQALSELGTPLFIMHGTADSQVSFEHAEKLNAAYPEADLWAVEGHDHLEVHRHPAYSSQLLGFLAGIVAQ